jgi:hypothetical protein
VELALCVRHRDGFEDAIRRALADANHLRWLYAHNAVVEL